MLNRETAKVSEISYWECRINTKESLYKDTFDSANMLWVRVISLEGEQMTHKHMSKSEDSRSHLFYFDRKSV